MFLVIWFNEDLSWTTHQQFKTGGKHNNNNNNNIP